VAALFETQYSVLVENGRVKAWRCRPCPSRRLSSKLRLWHVEHWRRYSDNESDARRKEHCSHTILNHFDSERGLRRRRRRAARTSIERRPFTQGKAKRGEARRSSASYLLYAHSQSGTHHACQAFPFPTSNLLLSLFLCFLSRPGPRPPNSRRDDSSCVEPSRVELGSRVFFSQGAASFTIVLRVALMPLQCSRPTKTNPPCCSLLEGGGLRAHAIGAMNSEVVATVPSLAPAAKVFTPERYPSRFAGTDASLHRVEGFVSVRKGEQEEGEGS